MRLLATLLSVALTTMAFQMPNLIDFLPALPISIHDYIQPNDTSPPHDLLKRQYSNTCPTNFHACSNLGAPGLCCASAAVCSADAAGNVACCPSGAACSGTIGGVITSGTVNSIGSVMAATSGSGATAGAGALTTATTSSFIYAGASTTTSAGLVAASAPSTVSSLAGQYNPTTSGSGFIVDGTSTVATPGAGIRAAEVPFIARLIVSAVQYLPI